MPFRELFSSADVRDEGEYVRELIDEYAAGLEPDRRYLFGTYRFVDMARKVVGVGSVGTRAWVFLLVGRDGKDPLMLQAKEAQASVLERYLGASEFDNHGERVVRGQRMDQAASDVFLGWQRSQGLGRTGTRLLRSPALGLEGLDRPIEDDLAQAFTPTHAPRGWSLARAHARSGDRLAIAAYLGRGSKFDQAIATFAAAYADNNEADYRRLADTVEAGEVPALRGV